ncbi:MULTISPECIES: hypothetical protein [Streptomycetaceae]|uniref:Uncharacterized protein n=1 Tax=Streptantibioticus cattleyicolor (strain ATCC 35852 / DSM 46488 / JCM 4925 / NBRC 14057 / NRRL 8057) TaxID=1003195 RepID=F8JY55_STREN|nr:MULTISPECIES: hypothetical protein [Streptomycetaceae]AEW94631.1 hypothetical protein SCATT_22600 [Streptantibioticus cattleyicolor NRRL 8057 = DSM 46488]MYS59269.1 hypothetical protein [Streptomyces sp. SID5468]CCB74988.1 putative Predicted protein [Streptantibioticus cattleyicolor NRRL 8057 = DSM 46488]
MPWVRLDDRFPSNRKIRLLSDAAFRLYVSAICWSAENLTDGVVKTAELRLVADVRSARRHAKELVESSLWEELPDGWRIHDYHEYQPTAEQVRADRKAKAARQQRWRERQKGAPAPASTDQPATGVDASTDASRDASHDAERDAAPRARVPDPTRPAPIGGTQREHSDRRGDPGPALSLIPTGWQPSRDDIAAAQQARLAAGRPALTGAELAEVTRKFVRRQHADRRQAANWGARWQEWAERERPTPQMQGAFLVPLPGGADQPPLDRAAAARRAARHELDRIADELRANGGPS